MRIGIQHCRVIAHRRMHSLGALHLDPYLTGRSMTGFAAQLQAWRDRLTAEYGLAEAQDADLAMPEPLGAFGQALVYLRRALPFQSGEKRGPTLKAIAQALLSTESLGGPADRDEALAAAQEALEIATAAGDLNRIASLKGALTNFGLLEQGTGAPMTFTNLEQSDPNSLIERLGEVPTLERYVLAISDSSAAPADALAILSRIWPVIADRRHESVRIRLSRSFHQIVAQWAADVGANPTAMSQVAGQATATVARANSERWPPEKIAAILAGIAVATTREDPLSGIGPTSADGA